MTPPRLVIFDCDGVLVDSEPISNGVLAEMLAEEGWGLTLAQARAEFQGLRLSQVTERIEATLGRPLRPGWIDDYVERRAAVFDERLEPVPGAAELVRRIGERGIAVCVASQGSLAKTARSLALTGLDRLFAPGARFSADEVEHGKPHPDLFLHAAASLGVPPGRCAVIEDTPSGVTAAVAAGMAAFGFSADSDEAALRGAGALTAPTLERIGAMVLAPSEMTVDT